MDMNRQVARLAMGMARVYTTPPDALRGDAPPLSLIPEELGAVACLLLELSWRMLESSVGALRRLAAQTPDAGTLAGLLHGFDLRQPSYREGPDRLEVSGCETLPPVLLPWLATGMVAAGALLIPEPRHNNAYDLKRQLLDRLQQIERLTMTEPAVGPVQSPPPEEAVPAVRVQPSGESAIAPIPETSTESEAKPATTSPRRLR
ncbi:hypothetical protein HF289_12325 [Acidithiobacillus ferrooxidans]|uniref:hypothetical protein n=1 Tax=Acidithiobacillus ferrooxidans TaxID=920 RepID=UPI001C07773D|nr:hypothetical protein [Acidithiobacillus ferrooxidans]MBU2857622.1 hypothetical protein [Acidithiobacillus ferrooxidans]